MYLIYRKSKPYPSSSQSPKGINKQDMSKIAISSITWDIPVVKSHYAITSNTKSMIFPVFHLWENILSQLHLSYKCCGNSKIKSKTQIMQMVKILGSTRMDDINFLNLYQDFIWEFYFIEPCTDIFIFIFFVSGLSYFVRLNFS